MVWTRFNPADHCIEPQTMISRMTYILAYLPKKIIVDVPVCQKTTECQVRYARTLLGYLLLWIIVARNQQETPEMSPNVSKG